MLSYLFVKKIPLICLPTIIVATCHVTFRQLFLAVICKLSPVLLLTVVSSLEGGGGVAVNVPSAQGMPPLNWTGLHAPPPPPRRTAA